MIDDGFKLADETLIRALLEQWAYTTRSGNKNEVLANHAPDVIIFDVFPQFVP